MSYVLWLTANPPNFETHMLGPKEDRVGRYNAVPIQHLLPAWSRSE
jgi:hypothetical protein